MSERGSCNKPVGEKCKQQILSPKEFTFVVSFFSCEQHDGWKREQTTELMRCLDVFITAKKYSMKFESETTTVWLFLNYYMGINSFLLLYYIIFTYVSVLRHMCFR